MRTMKITKTILDLIGNMLLHVHNNNDDNLNDFAEHLCDKQFISLLLTLLRNQQHTRTAAASSRINSNFTSATTSNTATTPTIHGYITRILRCIALLTSVSQRAVNDVADDDGDGLYTILNFGAIDMYNPTAREWMLYCVKNCTLKNARNQQLLNELQIQSIVNTDELQHMGLNAAVDQSTGKIRISNVNDKMNGNTSTSTIPRQLQHEASRSEVKEAADELSAFRDLTTAQCHDDSKDSNEEMEHDFM
jgi:hypothetical protein